MARACAFLLFLFLPCLVSCTGVLAGKQPNIVLFLMDQERAPPSYEPAAWAEYRKKHFKGRNDIAAHGMSFEQHYITSAACVPSRASLYTGQHIDLHGVDQTTGLGKSNADPGLHWLVPGYVPTVGDYMRAAGYRSAYIGKWHISEEDISVNGTVVAGGDDPAQTALYKKQQPLNKYGFDDWIGPEPHGIAMENTGMERDDGFAAQAVEWLQRRNQSDDDTPFFLAINFVNPHDICLLHAPLWKLYEKAIDDGLCPKSPYATPTLDEDLLAAGKPRLQQQYRQILDTSDFSTRFRRFFYSQADEECFYYFLLKEVDRHIQTVYDTLKNTRFFENTIIVQTADHGELLGAHGGLVQKWHNAYQESIRVPFVVSNPRMFPEPVTQGQILTSHLDIVPTLVALTGAKEEDLMLKLRATHQEVHPFPGRDLTPLLIPSSSTAKDAQHFSSPVYFYTRDSPFSGQTQTWNLRRALGSVMDVLLVFFGMAGWDFDAPWAPENVEAIIHRRDDGKVWKLVKYWDDPSRWSHPHKNHSYLLRVGGHLTNPPHPQFSTAGKVVTRTAPLPDEYELYCLDDDPAEAKNLALFGTAHSKQVLEDMQSMLLKKRADVQHSAATPRPELPHTHEQLVFAPLPLVVTLQKTIKMVALVSSSLLVIAVAKRFI